MRRSLWIVVAALLASAPACSASKSAVVWDIPEDATSTPHVPGGTVQFAAAFREGVGSPMVGGNRAELVENGRIFDAVEKEIAAARSSVHVEIFIWRKSEPSDRLVKAIQARRPGVACRIVVDPAGSIGFDGDVKPALEAAGCEVHAFKPMTEVTPGEYLERNHRKVVIVDGRVALTGGFGIWKSWLGDGRSKEEWRDTNVRVEGPVVEEFQEAFARTWQEVGGGELPKSAFAKTKPQVGDARAGLVASSEAPSLEDVSPPERAIWLVISSAKKRLWIANSYFVPSDGLIKLIAAKRREGVDVRVLAPGPVHDWKSIRAAQRATYAPLLEAGVRIWEYQPSMMHAKTVLVDDRLVMVGSTNLDPLSLRQMEEDSVVIEDPELAGQLARSFQEDLRYAQEQRKDRSTGPIEALSRQFFWFIGRFL